MKKALSYLMDSNDIEVLPIKVFGNIFKVYIENDTVKIENKLDYLPKIVSDTALFVDPESKEAHMIRGVLCYALGYFIDINYGIVINKDGNKYLIGPEENGKIFVSQIRGEDVNKEFEIIDVRQYNQMSYPCLYDSK